MTDERPEFSNEYLVSLVLASALVLIMIFVVAPMAGDPLHLERSAPYIYAWVIAGGLTIAQGLSEFSGQAVEVVSLSVQISVLVSLLVVGVVAPTLTLRLMPTAQTGRAPQGARAFYLFGLIIAATFAFTVVPTGYVGWRVGESMREAQAVQRNKDLMINDLNVIAMRVREYRILPQRLGGGGGSTAGFTLAGDVAQTDEGTYFAEARDDAVYITARSLKYDGSGIAVTVDRKIGLTGWSFDGRFQ
jgi:hypothetical protein